MNSFELEFASYLNDEKTDLEVIKCYKRLLPMFLKFNTILSTSASVERVFSYAGLVNAPRRKNLSDALFEKTVFLKLNKKKFNV